MSEEKKAAEQLVQYYQELASKITQDNALLQARLNKSEDDLKALQIKCKASSNSLMTTSKANTETEEDSNLRSELSQAWETHGKSSMGRIYVDSVFDMLSQKDGANSESKSINERNAKVAIKDIIKSW